MGAAYNAFPNLVREIKSLSLRREGRIDGF
jgi:hypothetical protein